MDDTARICYPDPHSMLGVRIMKAKVYPVSGRQRRWYVYLYWKGRRYKRYMYDATHPFYARELAEDVAGAVNADILRLGKAFDPRRWFTQKTSEMLLENYAAKWWDRQRHYAPSYAGDVKRYLFNVICPVLGRDDIRELTKGRVRELQETLGRYAPKTQENILGVLHKVLADAYDNEDITRVPPFPRIEVPEPELRWMQKSAVEAVIEQIAEHDRPIFIFGFFHAMRPGEARALHWEDVEWAKREFVIRRTFSGGVLRQTTKTRQARPLPLEESMTELLQPLRGISGFVFRTSFGKPYRKQRLGELWRNAGGEMPLYNAMRHSRAMWLLNRAEDPWSLDDVRYLLGHTRTRTTERYARVSVERIRGRM